MEENTWGKKISIAEQKVSTIRVEKLRLRAYIGFNDWERKKMQDLVLSYSLKYNMFWAVEKDDVALSYNYKTLTKSIIKLIEHQKFDLIETVAEIIYDRIKEHPYVFGVKVRVEKPFALRFTDNVMIEIDEADRYNEAIISLGSNINAEVNTKVALEKLKTLGSIAEQTEFISTKPLKYEDQADFINGAAKLYTKLNLEQLILSLKKIEVELGRIKTANKNAERTIDLDVTLYNNHIIDTDVHEFDFLKHFVKQLKPGLELG